MQCYQEIENDLHEEGQYYAKHYPPTKITNKIDIQLEAELFKKSIFSLGEDNTQNIFLNIYFIMKLREKRRTGPRGLTISDIAGTDSTTV